MQREIKFRDWMDKRKTNAGIDYEPKTINTHVSDLCRIEKAEKIDLDEEFKANRLKRLIDLYTYSADDARADLPNPTNLKTTSKSLYGFLSAYKSQINKYREFCEKHPPKQEIKT